jgi:tRNA-specific 2-thiouridylase
MTNKKQKVIAAMSGGVDSSIATAILKKNDYNVVGVFMKFWAPQERGKQEPAAARENLCCSAEAQADAGRIARKLRIPFYVLDFRKEFKQKVVDYLIDEYKKGRTPNPCVECNRWIKFRFLMDKAMALDAQYIATGHYARVNEGRLFKGRDKTKDQSYFLWTLSQSQLKRVLFPIGDCTKKEVKAMAKKWDLPVYEKKESQEICFIPDADINKFLKKRVGIKKGSIITTKGEKIGEHEGLAYYTIGQRKGIKVGGIGPFYVVDKDFNKNILIVAQGDFDDALFKKEMRVKGANWINKVKFPLKCQVKIRYLTPSVPATIKGNKVIFNKKQRAITPGQSAVFYKGNEVLGGGIIC